MLWKDISNTRMSVSSDIQTLRSWLKILGWAPLFQPTSQCLDIWWNTLLCIWCPTLRMDHLIVCCSLSSAELTCYIFKSANSVDQFWQNGKFSLFVFFSLFFLRLFIWVFSPFFIYFFVHFLLSSGPFLPSFLLLIFIYSLFPFLPYVLFIIYLLIICFFVWLFFHFR